MKRIFKMLGAILFAALVASCAFFLFLIYRSPRLGGGEAHAYYLGGSSSARVIYNDDPAAKIFLQGVRGESAQYMGDRVEEFRRKWSAELLFTEEVCGTTAYYLYSPQLGAGVALNGSVVNLQIAFDGERTAVGTPLIFGGW